MAKELLPNALWARIPPEPPKPKGGRPSIARESKRRTLEIDANACR